MNKLVVKIICQHEIAYFLDATAAVQVLILGSLGKIWKVTLQLGIFLAYIDEYERQNGGEHKQQIAPPVTAKLVEQSGRLHSGSPIYLTYLYRKIMSIIIKTKTIKIKKGTLTSLFLFGSRKLTETLSKIRNCKKYLFGKINRKKFLKKEMLVKFWPK
jgi:hypothetical protein